jgi:4-diphosphocytidyl-2-C-methyl-D-erythritol kinase
MIGASGAPELLRDCPAPAKLNLFLHVTGRRPDGYHLLQSAFVLIDRADRLHFRLRYDGAIVRRTEVPGVPEQQDLIIRALHLLAAEVARRHGRVPGGVDVEIDKILPMGGGLGGGSSDAATALLAMNHLWQAGLTRAELMALGLPLGADIPFFLFGQNAFAEGVGEALQPLPVPETCFVVLEPGVSVATAAIFSSPDLTRDTKPVKITDFSRHLDSRSDVGGFGRNDLQAVASRLFPQVQAALDWLGQFGQARMTGSGSCVFCAFSSDSEAQAVLEQVPAHWTAWKAKSLARHPLSGLLQID